MTSEGVKALLKTLSIFYPRSYGFKDADTARVWTEDLDESFSKWSDEEVTQALKSWRKEHSEAPQVADLLREVKILAIDKKPAEPLPEEDKPKVTYAENPWGKAQAALQREIARDPKTKHNWLFHVLREQGYQEYLKAREAAINAKNRRNEENRKLGLPEDTRATEATFKSPSEKAYYMKLITEGKI